ncbi:hypothetical protein MVES1_001177 [Malassezia vespertilionis]|uniref:Rhodanese domain-containing protein n=1 Tax=Malassezia vespertilionis TaxID=2020962 RepID=A0A2N1JF83_9BASI|nr:uncharacterized protein MVES1_001177 [Malassezia vespertilionis]PKI85208.1 hypothetical protein MVES_001111 [Malassezia vespertilionis]WFD05843.1 hypothetical protein MVES1_001177 [Malassezia vespertilionis]
MLVARSIVPIAARSLRSAPLRAVLKMPAATSHTLYVRAMSATAPSFKKDMSWVEQGNVTYDELKPYTQHPSGEITLIDVREPQETAQGMIPSAVNVPLSAFSVAFDVNSSAPPSADFEKIFSFPRPTYDHKIVFYCRTGRRSAEAMEIARNRGWWDTRNYRGGWVEWEAQQKDAKEQD